MSRHLRLDFKLLKATGMEIKKGIAVSPGISIAKSLIIDSEDYRIPQRFVESSQRTSEIQRARDAFKTAADELAHLAAEQQAKGQRKI